MGSVTQKVNNYVLGISEQPDELKSPGQVVDMVNGVPDLTRGLTKRPGSQLVAQISPDTGAKTRWFSIYTDLDEQYIGQMSNSGVAKIWRCSDGVEIPLHYPTTIGSAKVDYLDNSSISASTGDDIQPLTIGETTFFCNRKKKVAMKKGANDKSPPLVNEAYLTLDTISYGKQYGFDIFTPSTTTTYSYPRATAIGARETIDTSNISGYADDGKCEGQAREVATPADTNSGTGICSTSPPNPSSGGKTNLQYDMDVRCTPVPQPGGGSNDYDDSYQPYAKLQFGGEGWTTGNTHTFRNTKGLETTVEITNHVTITGRGDIAMVRPHPTSATTEEHVSSEAILGGMKSTLDAISGTGITATIIGNGLHLYRATPFSITTPERTLINIVTAKANDVSELPTTCRHGYVCQVSNTDTEHDDYYVKFRGSGIEDDIHQFITYTRSGTTVTVAATAHGLSNGDKIVIDFTSGGATDGIYTIANVATNSFTITDSASGSITGTNTGVFWPWRAGEGVWEECVAPDMEISFDETTMPVKLVRVNPSVQHVIATSSVNTTNETITITGHEYDTGDTLTYLSGGGTALAGLSNLTKYYVIKVDANTIKLATTSANATDGTAINLTGTGNNAQSLGTYYGVSSVNSGAVQHHPNGAFEFGYPDWTSRDAGDDVTNAPASFVGFTIEKMVFFKNRIALLSAENVITSRVNDFYNFWNKTALTISNVDPIDLQSSSTYPTKLFDAVEVSAGLALFSANQQFLLHSGAEALLTAETAQISFLASYAYNKQCRPFSMGTTVGFINSTSKNGRFYEMANIQSRGEPDVLEQSKVVSKLFPEAVTLPAESTENDMILFGVDPVLFTTNLSAFANDTASSNEIWGYRFFNQGQKRIQSAWFRWTLPNTLVYHSIMDDVYYVVLSDKAGNFSLEKFDVKRSDTTDLVGTLPNDYRVHLDTKKQITSANLTHNTTTDKTTFTLGAGYYGDSSKIRCYTTNTGDKIGRTATPDSITGSSPNQTVTLDGNWKYFNKIFKHTGVNTTAETITLTSHNLSTGDTVVYKTPTTYTGQTQDSGIGGLSNSTTYYIIKIDEDTFKLATSSANATAGTAINLTSQGTATASSTLEVLTDLVVGYEYELEVELPKVYVTKAEGEKIRADTRGSLIVHRLKFNFGSVGVIDVMLKRKGRPDYTNTFESIEWDVYKAGNLAVAPDYIHTIPVYDRNTNVSILLKSNHPSPATLHSMSWEGDYNSKFYQRV